MILVRLTAIGNADATGFCNASGEAQVQRVEAVCAGEGHNAIVHPRGDGSKPLTLLNLLHSLPGSPLAKIAAIFSEIESISHILAWTEAALGEPLSVSLVELPRLGLTFTARVEDGELRFYCKEHAGLFVSNRRSSDLDELLRGFPCALLLTNATREFFIVANAAVRPFRPNQSEYFPTALVLDRKDDAWISNLSVPHYLYQIHISGKFLMMPTLSSMFYVLLMRFFARQYGEVFKVANSCVTDTDLTKEERQVIILRTRNHFNHSKAVPRSKGLHYHHNLRNFLFSFLNSLIVAALESLGVDKCR